jgi:hypothetical protein
MFRTATSALCLAILVGFPVLGQRMALNHSALTFATSTKQFAGRPNQWQLPRTSSNSLSDLSKIRFGDPAS